jgi:molybdopterin synthase catalytic subunit
MPAYRVLLFAAHREAAGRSTLALDLPEGARVADARTAIVRQVPAIGGAVRATIIAVNGQYADDQRVLRKGDQLAAFPPVAGG